MTGDSPVSTRRVRAALVGALVTLVVAGAAIVVLWPHAKTAPAPRTDVEAVMRVHGDFVEAFIEGEYGRVWGLLGNPARDWIEQALVCWRKNPPASLGISKDELRNMDAATLVEVAMRRRAESHPRERAEELERLRTLRILRVEMDGDMSSVICDGTAWSGIGWPYGRAPRLREVEFIYVRNEGEWRFSQGELVPLVPPFRFLEKKVAAFLPKLDRLALRPLVDAVVTVGAEGISEEGARLLTARLRECVETPAKAVVVLDVASRASWGSVVRSHDAIRLAGIEEIAFATATEAGPPPGVWVNGLPVGAPYDPERAAIDPDVCDRVITIGR